MATLTSTKGFFLSKEKIRALKAKNKSSTVIAVSKGKKSGKIKIKALEEGSNEFAAEAGRNDISESDIENLTVAPKVRVSKGNNDVEEQEGAERKAKVTYRRASPNELKKLFSTPLKDFLPITGF